MTLDDLLDHQPPDVRAEIEAITTQAGTWDADWAVLLAARAHVHADSAEKALTIWNTRAK